MKTPEEMMEYFRSMPSKKKENPYWTFEDDPSVVKSKFPGAGLKPFDLESAKPLLSIVREFFRRYYESFRTEAQVLCVTPEDGCKLAAMGIPVLTKGQIGPFEVMAMVLPQNNFMGNTVVSEVFWQARIVEEDIKPVARIHSHHVLNPYQSNTDYSTLNSGTLEVVMGRIYDDKFHLCYWLDVPGTDVKAQTFVASENDFGEFTVDLRKFNGGEGQPEITDKLRTKPDMNTDVGVCAGLKIPVGKVTSNKQQIDKAAELCVQMTEKMCTDDGGEET